MIAGCLIDGHHGHYGTVALLELALAHGMPNSPDKDGIGYAEVAADYRETGGLGDHCEFIAECSDDAEDWLNDNIAPEGHQFGWSDGEFFLLTTEEWDFL